MSSTTLHEHRSGHVALAAIDNLVTVSGVPGLEDERVIIDLVLRLHRGDQIDQECFDRIRAIQNRLSEFDEVAADSVLVMLSASRNPVRWVAALLAGCRASRHLLLLLLVAETLGNTDRTGLAAKLSRRALLGEPRVLEALLRKAAPALPLRQRCRLWGDYLFATAEVLHFELRADLDCGPEEFEKLPWSRRAAVLAARGIGDHRGAERGSLLYSGRSLEFAISRMGGFRRLSRRGGPAVRHALGRMGYRDGRGSRRSPRANAALGSLFVATSLLASLTLGALSISGWDSCVRTLEEDVSAFVLGEIRRESGSTHGGRP